MAPRHELTRRRIMRNFVIKELSAVDRPAQAHALAVIMKRDDDDAPMTDLEKKQLEDVQKAVADLTSNLAAFNKGRGNPNHVPKGSSKGGQFTSGPGGGRPGTDQVGDKELAAAEAKLEAAQEKLLALGYPKARLQDALVHAYDDHAGDATVAQLVSTARDVLEDDWGVRRRAKKNDDANDNHEGDDPMTDAEKKQLDELQKNVADLTTQLAAATDAVKKSGDIQKALDAATTKLDELTKALEAAETEKAEAIAKAGMSADEKAHCADMDDAGKKEFMALSPEDRRKKMKKSADDNPVVYKAIDGTEFRKSDGDKVIALAKRADESDKTAKAETEKRETSEFGKRADDELKYFSDEVAKRDDKVEVLRAVSKMEEGPRKALEKMLEVGGKAISAAFATIGHQHADIAKSAQDFNKRVTEVMARDKIDKLSALEKARTEFPAEFKAYQDAGASNN